MGAVGGSESSRGCSKGRDTGPVAGRISSAFSSLVNASNVRGGVPMTRGTNVSPGFMPMTSRQRRRGWELWARTFSRCFPKALRCGPVHSDAMRGRGVPGSSCRNHIWVSSNPKRQPEGSQGSPSRKRLRNVSLILSSSLSDGLGSQICNRYRAPSPSRRTNSHTQAEWPGAASIEARFATQA